VTRRRIGAVLAVAAVFVGVVATRAVWQGREALSRGDAALAANTPDEAIRWWRRAARWYVPMAPHVASAYARLEELATQAEAAGDRATALAAWQGIRGSILATRSVYVPFEERLEPANRRIAALMAAAEDPALDAGKTTADREAWHYALLARDEAPSVPWTLLALAGFGLWIGGAALFAWRGVDANDRLVRATAARSGLLVVFGLVLWLLGLYQA
jgi:hypothetical protein